MGIRGFEKISMLMLTFLCLCVKLNLVQAMTFVFLRM